MKIVRRLGFTFTIVAFGLLPTMAGAQEDLIYVSVDPCRIADTRKSSEGELIAGESRNFRISGTAAQLAAQGGEVNCLDPRQVPGVRPKSVVAYVIAVPSPSSLGNGALSVYPSDLPPPPVGSGTTVNFTESANTGNTTIVSVCDENCPAEGELAVLARNSNRDVVIDVQGYFYSQSDASECRTSDLAGVWTTFIADAAVGGSACALTVSDTGVVTEGFCASTNGDVEFNSGSLTVAPDCLVGGSIFTDGIENLVEIASLTIDKNQILGILTIQGQSTTFNAVRVLRD